MSDSEDDEWVPPTTARLDSDDSLDRESSGETIISDSNDSDTSDDETDKSDDGIPLATLRMRTVATTPALPDAPTVTNETVIATSAQTQCLQPKAVLGKDQTTEWFEIPFLEQRTAKETS